MERARVDMPGWSAERVDRMSKPDLPAFDAAAATGAGGTTSGPSRSRRSKSKSDPIADVWDTE